MAYKIKPKKKKDKKESLWEQFKWSYRAFEQAVPQKKAKKKSKYDIKKVPKGYPKYTWFYGKERKELISKMSKGEKRMLTTMEKEIRDIVVLIDVVNVSGAGMLFYTAPSLLLTTPFGVLSSVKLRKMLKERRAFLKMMHDKYIKKKK